jgi:hypothetical protein
VIRSKCLIPNCVEQGSSNGLCGKHYFYHQILLNTSAENLGVLKFAQVVVPEAFKNFSRGLPAFHKDILYQVAREEKKWTLFDRKVVIAAPRGSAKTTLITKVYSLYEIALSTLNLKGYGKRYIVIVSKTARASKKILRWIKTALASQNFVSLFGDLRPELVRRATWESVPGKWTEDIIILTNGVVIEAIGMQQQLRSSAEGLENDRIDLLIADDVQTNENTKTSEALEDGLDYLFETLLPSVDVDTGKVVYIATIQKTGCILDVLLQQDDWRKLFFALTYENEDGKEISIWEEKYPVDLVHRMRVAYERAGKLGSFYKEYYNQLKNESEFNPSLIIKSNYEVLNRGGQNFLHRVTDGIDEWVPLFISIGVDFGSSEARGSHYSVVFALGTDPMGRRYVIHYSRGRYLLRDRVLEDSYKGEFLGYDDRNRINKVGVCDETVRVAQRYHAEVITCERAGQQHGHIEQIRTLVRQAGLDKCAVVSQTPTSDDNKSKHERLFYGVLSEYQARNVIHLGDFPELVKELTSFGGTNDDILDAEYYAMRNARRPLDVRTTIDRIGRPQYNQTKQVTDWMVL